jgi:hypothetical protein
MRPARTLLALAAWWVPRAACQTVYPFDNHWARQYSASVVNGEMRLNPSVNNAGGIAWFDVPMYISDFTGSFDFYIGDPSAPVGCSLASTLTSPNCASSLSWIPLLL